MIPRRVKASAPGPKLPAVLREIIESLLGDDWYRVSTEDGGRKYYVVGCADQAAEINGEADFCRFEFPLPTKPGPLSVWATRAQLADNKPATFLSSARKQLDRAGMSSSAIDRFLAGDDLTDWKFDSGVSRDVRIELLTAFFEAMRLNAIDPRSLELDTDDREITEKS